VGMVQVSFFSNAVRGAGGGKVSPQADRWAATWAPIIYEI
ncbi:MAG: hypothetical protein QOH07_1897, partial [Mycobacterium sp.]|nr:hypothetical protein [Mycobacterium sp.]